MIKIGLTMKHQPVATIKLRKQYIKKSLVASAVLMALATPLSLTSRVYADQYDARIKALQADISHYQAQSDTLRGQAASLQGELDRLASDKAVIQGQIDLSQAKYDQLQQQIAETQAKIQTNKDVLGTVIAQMYVDDKITPLEMLASSKNISDYLDKEAYRATIRDQLVKTISTIKKLKATLDTQMIAVERTLTDGKNARAGLAAKEAERQTLLAQTNGQNEAYQTLARDKKSQVENLVSQQIASNMQAARNANSQTLVSGVAGGGGYPALWANAPSDSLVDSWNLYNRECVSYVAWKIASTGRFVPNFNGQGNANQWEGYVEGYVIKSGSTPVVGSAAVLYGGAYGHVMYVEAVSDDKSRITVSEYNYNWSGLYSKRSISSAGLTYLYF